jgi:hypothetical protein
MPFALELALDVTSAAVVRGLWRALGAEGFDFMTGSGFPRVDVFSSTGVVFLAPDADEALSHAHAVCHHVLGPHGENPWPHYAVGAWIPHCTLAQDLETTDAVARARAVAARTPLPLVGRLERAELIEFRPVRCLVTVPLGHAL